MPGRLEKVVSSGSVLLNQALSSLSSFAITFYLLQTIGVAGFGVYAIYSIIGLNVVGVLVGLIVLPAISIGYQVDPGDREDLRGATTTLIAVACVSIIGLGIIAAVSRDWLSLPVDGLLLAGLTASILIVEYLRRTFILFSSHALLWGMDVLRYALIAASFGIAEFRQLEWAPQTYVFAFACCNVMAAALASLVRLLMSGSISLTRSRPYWPRLLDAGKWLSLSAIMQFIMDNLLVLIASATLGPFAIGIVRACQTIVGLVNPLYMALENIVPKWLGAQIFESGMPTALRKYRLVGLGIFGAGAVALLAVATIAEWLLGIVAGPESAGYGWILQGLCLSSSAVLGSLLIGFVFRAWEQTRPIFFAYALASAGTVVIGIPLMLWLGMLGVVLGMMLAPLITLLSLATFQRAASRKQRTETTEGALTAVRPVQNAPGREPEAG